MKYAATCLVENRYTLVNTHIKCLSLVHYILKHKGP